MFKHTSAPVAIVLILAIHWKGPHMPVPAAILLAIPINNPFPVTLGLGVAAVAVFGAALTIATLRVHPRKWLYVLMAGCVAVGLILTLWSGYYILYGPPAAEPIAHISGAHNTYYDFYKAMWVGNVVISLLAIALALATGILLMRQRVKAT